MPRGKHTDDPKMSTKIFRVNETLNRYIENQAGKHNQSVSEWLRHLIERDMRNNL